LAHINIDKQGFIQREENKDLRIFLTLGCTAFILAWLA